MGIFGRNAAPAGAHSAKTIVAHGCEINGDLACEGSIHIDGIVEGRIRAGQALTIGKEGTFSGDAEVDHLLLSGAFHGRVHCQHASILNGGFLHGEVFCESLTIEEGGRLDGNCAHQAFRPASQAEQNDRDYLEHSPAHIAVALETKE